MKGIELPVNVLVLVAIALIVLIGLIGLYVLGFGPFSAVAGIEGVKNSLCRTLLLSRQCRGTTNSLSITDFDADQDGVIDGGTEWNGWTTRDATVDQDNLASLCWYYYGIRSETNCKALCQCAAPVSTGGGGPGAVCGNDIKEGLEECDGTDDTACPGQCQADCTCAACNCVWVIESIGCPPGDCNIQIGAIWYQGSQSTCQCNPAGCGTCTDSGGTDRPGDTGTTYCICNIDACNC